MGLDFGWKAGLGLALFSGISLPGAHGLFITAPFRRLEAQLLAFLVVGVAFVEERNRVRKPLKVFPSEPLGQVTGTQECLEQVSTMVCELLRQVRTPFASIEGAASILQENSTPSEKSDEFVDIIINECGRINLILSERGESMEIIPLACRPTDASSMLGEIIRLAALEHPDPCISFRIEVSPDLPQLWCDPMRVQQTMVPFVTSAMQAMSGGGEILLAADRQNGQGRIRLTVLGQTVRGSDAAEGRGSYSSTFDATGGARVLAARRTVLQHGGKLTLDQTGHLTKLLYLTLPVYNGQTS
jgi:signal transduction histidine kinase